jgi:hypothetical protein
MFADHGTSATMLWETASPVVVGGRLQQPIVVKSPVGVRLLCGAASANAVNDTTFSSDLYVLNPAVGPSEAGFIADHFVGAGGGSIVANGNVYTVGAEGLHAFGPVPARVDVDGDRVPGIGDLYTWEQGMGEGDVDQDGLIEGGDRVRLVREMRLLEQVGLVEGRR